MIYASPIGVIRRRLEAVEIVCLVELSVTRRLSLLDYFQIYAPMFLEWGRVSTLSWFIDCVKSSSLCSDVRVHSPCVCMRHL